MPLTVLVHATRQGPCNSGWALARSSTEGHAGPPERADNPPELPREIALPVLLYQDASRTL